MMTECGSCGKRIVIHQPEFYVYRRGGTFFCSESCMVVWNTKLTGFEVFDFRKKKGQEDMSKHKLTLEQKKKAVEIYAQGGDPQKYLEECGAKNPSAAWYYIRQTLAKTGREEQSGIQEKSGPENDRAGQDGKPQQKEAAGQTTQAAEGTENRTAPADHDGFHVVTIEGEIGRYRNDQGTFTFDGRNTGQRFSVPAEKAALFITELTKAARILGIRI